MDEEVKIAEDSAEEAPAEMAPEAEAAPAEEESEAE